MSLDFNDLADIWLEARCYQTPSAIHGWLSGHIAAGARLQPAKWLQEAQELLSLDGDIQPNLHNALIEMYEQVLSDLSNDGLSYSLLLPSDEDADVDEQVDCLAQWSQGFLTGFGYAGRAQQTLPNDVQEVLQDLAAFAQAELDDHQDPDNELLYLELVEHAKVAALTVYYSMNNSTHTAPTQLQ